MNTHIHRLFTSAHLSPRSERGSIPGRITGFSQVGIVPDDAVGQWAFSGISRFPLPFIATPLHTHKISIMKNRLFTRDCTSLYKFRAGKEEEVSNARTYIDNWTHTCEDSLLEETRGQREETKINGLRDKASYTQLGIVLVMRTGRNKVYVSARRALKIKAVRAFISALPTLPGHADVLVVATRTKSGVINAYYPTAILHDSLTVGHDTIAVCGDVDVALRSLVVTVCVHVVLCHALIY
ncbi:hypothetical protein PR048_000780 [Dryococelus australis]|uniref:Uncharacterized protein n=1 Tax=Dryococelus australis TaxID=614101 RepID=A0ABQ9IG65_9NEOP|nr:hypothetical protein PR048_000780 [Dryococelus australis]